ncbi:MAG: PorV/PorQ family protein [candidate division WOR-3 bacterium]
MKNISFGYINHTHWIRFVSTYLLLLITYTIATPYAGDFEDFGASAKALGLGNAYTAVASDASAIYYNPAGSNLLNRSQILFLHSENYTGGIVQNNFISYVYLTKPQSYGVALLTNRIPDIKITKLPYPDLPPSDTNRPYIDRIVNASDWIVYFNYAHNIVTNLNLGFNFKLIYRSLGIGSAFGTGLDFGAIYQMPVDLMVATKISNLTTSPLFWSNKTREVIMPKLFVGLAKQIKLNNASLLLSSDLENNFDQNELYANFGAEYHYKNAFSLRAGLFRYNPCFGVGLNYKRFFLDYAFVSSSFQAELGSSHKMSGGILL